MPNTRQKDTLDRFYTKDSVAKYCVGLVDTFLDKVGCVVEPSAGGGAFIRALEGYNINSYDLSPTFNGVIKQDWFDTDISGQGKVAVVGNPPFGKRNKLSKAFIEHAISFDNTRVVAMILPNAWEKPSLQNRTFPSRWKLVTSERLPLNSFEFEGVDYKVPCVFQIWVLVKEYPELQDLRWGMNPLVTHKDFNIVKDKADADFFMMGASPKTLKNVSDVTKGNRGYYIKSNINVSVLKERLITIGWDEKGCATASGGVYWISQPELIKHYSDFVAKL